MKMNDKNILVPLFDGLKEKGIRYCVLRNYTSLPISAAGSDVDMWIHNDDLSTFYSLIDIIKQRNEFELVSFYGDETADKLCYLQSEAGVQIDVFKGHIYYKGLVMIDGDAILKHTVLYNGIRVLDDGFANIIAFIKEIINNGICESKYYETVLNKPIYTKEYLCENLYMFDEIFISLLYEALNSDRIESLMYELCIKARNGLSLKYFSFVGIELKKLKRLFKRPGYVIVVEGTDGSGKSFIINTISPILNEAFHRGVVYNHLRPNVIPDIAVLMGKRKKAEKEEVVVVSDPHAGKQSGFVGSIVRWGYYMIDYIFGYLKKVWPAIHTKSKVFIFDRYYYEYYFDQKRSHTSLPQWILRVGEWFLPRPDLILCLGGDPKKIYERKPETSLEEVMRQTKVLKDFCAKRQNAVWIDTTIAPEESVRCAMDAICDMMSKRFANVKLK